MSTSSPLHEKNSKCSESCGTARFSEMREIIKAYHTILAAVMIDVAALRRAVLEDPTFSVAYDHHLDGARRAAKPLLDEAMTKYDAIFRDASEIELWNH